MTDEKPNGGRLRHSSDNEPGYTRRKQGRYWAYFDEDGNRITDRDTASRAATGPTSTRTAIASPIVTRSTG
jgi:hypothetical protein